MVVTGEFKWLISHKIGLQFTVIFQPNGPKLVVSDVSFKPTFNSYMKRTKTGITGLNPSLQSVVIDQCQCS